MHGPKSTCLEQAGSDLTPHLGCSQVKATFLLPPHPPPSPPLPSPEPSIAAKLPLTSRCRSPASTKIRESRCRTQKTHGNRSMPAASTSISDCWNRMFDSPWVENPLLYPSMIWKALNGIPPPLARTNNSFLISSSAASDKDSLPVASCTTARENGTPENLCLAGPTPAFGAGMVSPSGTIPNCWPACTALPATSQNRSPMNWQPEISSASWPPDSTSNTAGFARLTKMSFTCCRWKIARPSMSMCTNLTRIPMKTAADSLARCNAASPGQPVSCCHSPDHGGRPAHNGPADSGRSGHTDSSSSQETPRSDSDCRSNRSRWQQHPPIPYATPSPIGRLSPVTPNCAAPHKIDSTAIPGSRNRPSDRSSKDSD